MISHYDDGRYGLSHLPNCEFQKYVQIAKRASQRSNSYSLRPFFDDYHHRLYAEDVLLHSARRYDMRGRIGLSIPYVKVEYSLAIWGETYRFEFDALYEPEIKLEKRNLDPLIEHHDDLLSNKSEKDHRKKSMLVYVLSFNLPDEKLLCIELPPSVIVFDVRRAIRVQHPRAFE
jgi:hypothetical protein